MNKYANGKLYRVESDWHPLNYIGSTCNSLEQRLCCHVSAFNGHGGSTKCSIDEILAKGDYVIRLIENYPCDTKEELLAREAHWIKIWGKACINKVIPLRTAKERYHQNIGGARDRILAKCKDYNRTHKAQKSAGDRAYRQRLGKISCVCGSTYSGSHKADHEKTDKHQNYMKTLN
jgi:hypothetical protein